MQTQVLASLENARASLTVPTAPTALRPETSTPEVYAVEPLADSAEGDAFSDDTETAERYDSTNDAAA